MLELSIPLQGTFVGMALIGFGLGAGAYLMARQGRPPMSRRTVVILGLIWIAWCTIEFWAVGPLSPPGRSDEVNQTIPWLVYLTRVHDGGLYAHAVAGGLDVQAGQMGAQFLSMERLLFSLLPLWVAIAVIRIGAIALSYAGGYLLGRRGFGLDRASGAALGVLAGAGHHYNFSSPVGAIGWGPALLPAVFYVLVVRTQRPWYYTTIVATAVVYSSSTIITHSLPACMVAVLLASALLKPARARRFALGTALFCAVCFLNWLEPLYALGVLSPELGRMDLVRLAPSLLEWLRDMDDVMVSLVTPVTIVVLASSRSRLALRGAVVVASAVAIGLLVGSVDLRWTGVSFLYAYRWILVSDGYTLVALVVAGLALATAGSSMRDRATRTRSIALVIYLAAVGVAASASQKYINLGQGFGTQRAFGGVACLSDAAWAPLDAFRMVSTASTATPMTLPAH